MIPGLSSGEASGLIVGALFLSTITIIILVVLTDHISFTSKSLGLLFTGKIFATS